MTLADLSAAVRERRVRAEELARRSLGRIERLNGPLNAVIRVREAALDDARALDARVDAGEDPGPLAGVPLLVKDMEDVIGIPTTYGSRAFADAPPATRDGLVPRRLRAAGAIVVGKTNQPEFAFSGYTDNLLYGPTRNPWGTDWSPGGSSGGSGAAMAAGMAPIATATDGGGSIRIPAAFCGLAGLKPSAGVIGREPIPDWIDLSTYGPLATSIADLRLLLSIEAGPVPGDPTALPAPLPMRDDLPARVIASPRLVDWGPLPSGVQASFDSALASIERDLGLPVERIEPSAIFRAGNPNEDWFTTCATEHVLRFGWDFCKEHEEEFGPEFRGIVHDVRSISIEDYLAVRRRRFAYAREFDELLGDDSVLVTPTMAVDGFAPDGTVPSTGQGPGFEAYNTDTQNITGHPAISVPAGVSANGIPFGITFSAPRFRDDLALAIGEAWERANPWPLAAPGYEPFSLDGPRL
ncbi:MAG TPA: amidase [Actinomycetota bacterium]|jgi:Asp-tRNA(Asn)/Glu-tRNA(Gln) amidotransferase A subunit family amidase